MINMVNLYDVLMDNGVFFLDLNFENFCIFL